MRLRGFPNGVFKMTGEDEDPINVADENAIRRNVAHEKDETASSKKSGQRRKPKKKGRPRKLWILLAVIVIIVIIVVPIAATFQMPTVNVIGASIKSQGSGLQKTYTSYATVEVVNPNMVGVTVMRISGSFYVNDVYGGDFLRTDQVSIVAAGTTDFDVQVLLKSAVPIHTHNTVEVKGTVTVQGSITWDVPFDETKDVSFP
jgi:LEA14-like dessication related protein